MSGIFYDLKKIKGLVFDVDGVLSPSVISMSEEGSLMRMVNVKDGYAIQLAAKYDYKIAIISGGSSRAIDIRYHELGIKDVYQGVSHKLETLKMWMRHNVLLPEEVIYIGDDIPDLMCMRYVGLPCCPHDAASEARQTAHYISPFSGGYGCVRDIVRQVLIANNQWMNKPDDYGW